jgi:hypothetical protein
MQQEYITQIEESMDSFIARERFRGQTIDSNKTYTVRREYDGKCAYVKGEKIIEQTIPLHEIILQRLQQEPIKELTQIEINALANDSFTAAKYMRFNMTDQLYQATIECAYRMISNGRLLQDYNKERPGAQKAITQMITRAEKVRAAAHTALENPESFMKLIHQEETEQQDTPITVRIQDEMIK